MADTRISRVFKKPVAWLLGRDLIASLQGTLLYTAFGSKLDPREWMTARELTPKELSFDEVAEQKEFWFDYIADSGDGTKATYGIAYLSLSNLFVDKLLTEMPSGTDSPEVRRISDGTLAELPRGKFLLVGGDTSYHLADYATLGSRFYQPFRWAYEDLWKKLTEENRTDERDDLEYRRPIFGIPGNHDYYDQLDGFRRQFVQPTREEKEGSYEANIPTPQVDYDDLPQLMLPGFKRLQRSSYVGLRLPFGWRLWGLDTEVGLIDEHQQNFFREIKKDARKEWKRLPENQGEAVPKLNDFPQKLIIATCSPTTSFGRFAREDDKKSAESFAQLKLPQPFMPNKGKGTISERSGDAKLNDGQCRVDLSGDYHFYARYWGPASAQRKPRKSDVEQPAAESYASVISGLGGAFHHPSQTYFGDLQEQALYPSEDISRKKFAGPLFNFTSVLKGGGVWIIGFFLAFTIYFTATVPQSGRQIVQNAFSYFHLAEPVIIEPTVLPVKTSPTPKTEPFVLYAENFDSKETKKYYFGSNQIDSSSTYFLNNGILILSLLAIVLSACLFPTSGKRSTVREKGGEKEIAVEKDPAMEAETPQTKGKKSPAELDPFQLFGSRTQLLFGVVVLASFSLLVYGMIHLMPFRDDVTPFGHSMMVFLTLLWSVASVVSSLRYSEWLFKQASVREIKRRDWVLPWMCAVFSVVSISAGIWLFGQYNMPAYLITDVLFILATVGIGGAVVALAIFVGGADFKWKGRVGMSFIGVLHAILQITVPFWLVSKGSAWALLAFLLLIVIFGWIGWQLAKSSHRWLLLLVWFLFGALTIALPYIIFRYGNHDVGFASYHGSVFELQGWLQSMTLGSVWESALYSFSVIVPSLIAGLIGLVLSCIWLGWYLAVSLAFNAHNNETGGAGRIEEFKEFIRFRLTENEITGYVIAFDKPEEDGSLLKTRLIDVFTLKVKGS